MRARLIEFPLADRLTAVAISSSTLSVPLGDYQMQLAVQGALRAAWDVHQGDEVRIEAICQLDREVRRSDWDDADAAAILRQVRVAQAWLEDARVDASVAALADGDSCLTTSWAVERGIDLLGAIGRLEACAGFLERRTRPGPPPRDLHAAARGLMDLEWPGDDD